MPWSRVEKLISESQFVRNLKALILQIWRGRSFWVRAAFCWGLGAALLGTSDASNYDFRFRLRGERSATNPIVIVEISEQDWAELSTDSAPGLYRSIKQGAGIADGYFWNLPIWQKLLSSILGQNPAVVGITLFFGDNIVHRYVSMTDRPAFMDARVNWAAELDSAGRPLVPIFASPLNSNVGIKSLRLDDDGLVRRFSSGFVQMPHLAVRMAEQYRPGSASLYIGDASQFIINFTGASKSFTTIDFKRIINGELAPDFFRDKIVIVGGQASTLDRLLTPIGPMSRSEVIANIVEHILSNRTIIRLPFWFYFSFLGLLVVAALRVVKTYPQSVTLVIFLLFSLVIAASSAWAFDIAKIWIPVIPTMTMLGAIYIVFLSYQLNQKERQAWRLEQEHVYLAEVERLKTNFMSMMSHDLKTPIAKIQAICDRIMASTSELPSAAVTDLKALRRSSDELHRYIQTILKVNQVEAKNFRLSREVLDLNELIDRVLHSLRPIAMEKNITLDTALEPIFSIEADTTLIQEVIHNIIENAIKYTPNGGRILVSSTENESEVVFACADNGPGISPEEQAGVWGKFTRGKDANPTIKGSGLGLYLVKYFIELHGGRVFLESQIGQGTKVGFALPFE